mmetsp:Transcript_16649/g.20181  ORF Transcript_16649/g.20181 Transcript_16649/m.20181 type:complete len:240 (+) Transcript_16649:342-1061(+)
MVETQTNSNELLDGLSSNFLIKTPINCRTLLESSCFTVSATICALVCPRQSSSKSPSFACSACSNTVLREVDELTSLFRFKDSAGSLLLPEEAFSSTAARSFFDISSTLSPSGRSSSSSSFSASSSSDISSSFGVASFEFASVTTFTLFSKAVFCFFATSDFSRSFSSSFSSSSSSIIVSSPAKDGNERLLSLNNFFKSIFSIIGLMSLDLAINALVADNNELANALALSILKLGSVLD